MASTSEGLSWERTASCWKRPSSVYRTWPVGERYSRWAGLNWKAWERALCFVAGRHSTVRQRRCQVQVICRRRPLLVRTTVGAPADWYGRKWTTTWTFDGATHFRSATTATVAVIGSPKRCTGGSTLAYILSGRFRPRTEPPWTGGTSAPAGAAAPRAVSMAVTAMTAARLIPALPAPSSGGRPTEETRRGSHPDRASRSAPAPSRTPGRSS